MRAEAIESHTDRTRAHAVTPEDAKAQATHYEAEDGIAVDWNSVTTHRAPPKAVLHMRVDQDVRDVFKQDGQGYRAKINAVLRAHKEAQSRKG